MSEHTLDAAGLVRVLVEPIVEHKDELEVTESILETGEILVEISINEEDAGKVIGRQGRVIKAIRTLAWAAASRAGERVEVELID